MLGSYITSAHLKGLFSLVSGMQNINGFKWAADWDDSMKEAAAISVVFLFI